MVVYFNQNNVRCRSFRNSVFVRELQIKLQQQQIWTRTTFLVSNDNTNKLDNNNNDTNDGFAANDDDANISSL